MNRQNMYIHTKGHHRQQRRKGRRDAGVQAPRLPMGMRLKDANSASHSHIKATETQSGEARPEHPQDLTESPAYKLDFQVRDKPFLLRRGKHPFLPLDILKWPGLARRGSYPCAPGGRSPEG